MNPIEIELFENENLRVPFSDWLDTLNPSDKYRIEVRLARVQSGNLGDSKSLGGGIQELRLAFGPGYRIYYVRTGANRIALLTGGSKATQFRDILKARAFYAEYTEKAAQADD